MASVKRTALNQLFWYAHTLREHLWHKRDFRGKLAIIRARTDAQQSARHASWGAPADTLISTGAACTIPINRPISEQIRELTAFDPDYLLVYPSNLAGLLDAGLHLPNLKQIKTLGETLSSETRLRAQTQLGCEVFDNYSSQELGNIALQCPNTKLYHLMTENLIVEILDTDNHPCREGEIGRVVITDLYNLATPLIRYDIGDYAEVGSTCSCGRTLPTLKCILGRTRNMLTINGEKSWPLVGFHRYRDIAPIIQYQLVQTTEMLMCAWLSNTP